MAAEGAGELRVWRADVGAGSVWQETVPARWQRLGGRGLIARVLLDEVPPTCDPLGPHAKLIWAAGLLAGRGLSSCDRISAGGKSPLTGGVKESNAGGSTARKLARLGVKALILQGWPQSQSLKVLVLDAQGGHFEDGEELAGLGVYAAARALRARYGDRVGLILIGPAGEKRMAAAGILNLDKDLEPSRINARGGLGAVMGAKGVKAVVIDDAAGQDPPLHAPALLQRARQSYLQALLDHPQTQVYADYGTAAMTQMSNGFGGLPTRNFSQGTFEGAERIGGEALRALLLQRGGESETTHACMAGCVIRCSNCFSDEGGRKVVSPVEYESIGLLGANLGIDDLDAIARMNWELNDLGLDTIEVGAALGVAAEAGLMDFGDGERALELIAEIRQQTPLGRVLGNGVVVTGRVFGVRRVPAVKGQAISAYDPRAIKGTGVTYATSPQGADHTAGLTIRARINHLDPQGQTKVSRKAQIAMAGYDTLGACLFAGFGFAKAPGAIRDLLRGCYGWEVGDEILSELGQETLRLEREFNRRAGFGPQDDRLPEWMTQEPLPPHNSVFDVPPEELDRVFEQAADRRPRSACLPPGAASTQ